MLLTVCVSGAYQFRNSDPLRTKVLYSFKQHFILTCGPQAFPRASQLRPAFPAVLGVAVCDRLRHAAPADGGVGAKALALLLPFSEQHTVFFGGPTPGASRHH